MAKLDDVKIDLVGADGNAFSILSRVQKAMRRAGHSDQWAEFEAEATSSDYDHLLSTTLAWVVCDEDDEDE